MFQYVWCSSWPCLEMILLDWFLKCGMNRGGGNVAWRYCCVSFLLLYYHWHWWIAVLYLAWEIFINIFSCCFTSIPSNIWWSIIVFICLTSFGSFAFLSFLLSIGLDFKLLAACLLLYGYIGYIAGKGWFISEIGLFITGIPHIVHLNNFLWLLELCDFTSLL